jgi:CRP-like cAMP-binding protein
MASTLKYIDPALQEQAYLYMQKFMSLTPQEMQELLTYCEFRQCDKKEILLNEGEVDNYLSLVVKGLVIKYVKIGKGENILQLATEGHVVHSEISFLTRQPSPVVIQCLEPSLLVSISHDNMERALENFAQGETLGRKIMEWMYIKKDERRYNWQSKSTKQRFLDYMENHPHMLQRIPQKYLASYLHIKPETFSRLKHLTRSK